MKSKEKRPLPSAKNKTSKLNTAKPTKASLAKASLVQAGLAARYPKPQTHLVASSPWELLVATVLSAQCTDERVNKVTPNLFALWPRVQDLAVANLADVENCIKSTGFYHNKAKNIIAAAQRIVEVYGGEVPRTMQDLCTLGGVARKTANVVLWGAFGLNEGIAVDTHVARIALRLGLTTTREPKLAEQQLMLLFPKEEWGNVNHRLVWFGRHVCIARKPKCNTCEFLDICVAKGIDI